MDPPHVTGIGSLEDVEMLVQDTSLTCVRHLRGHEVWAYISVVPVLAIAFQAGCAWHSRSVRQAALLAGFAANEVVNHALKHHFRIPRPPTCEYLQACHTFGFPSSHSQAMWFYITAGLLSMSAAAPRQVERGSGAKAGPGGCREGAGLAHAATARATAAALASLASAIAVPVSRVILGYHTLPQVLAGAAIGAGVGALWHVLVVHGPVCAAVLRLAEDALAWGRERKGD